MPGDVTLRVSGQDLVLTLSSGDTVTVKNHYAGNGENEIERILFADGTVIQGAALVDVTLIGTELNGKRTSESSCQPSSVMR